MLRLLFRATIADRVIVADPSLGVALPRRRSREASTAIPSEQQVGATLRAVRSEFRGFIALCAFAGLRSGEAAGIPIGDIDLRELRIARQVQREVAVGAPRYESEREVAVGAPKYESERVIFGPQELVTILSQHIDTFPPDAGPRSLLFRTADGKPLDRNAVHFRWRSSASTARVVGVRLHDLRHSSPQD